MASANPQGLQRELTTLIKRLEAATSRLEDIAQSTTSAALIPAPAADAPSAPAAPAAPAQAESASVSAYSELISGPLASYVSLSKEVGGLVNDQAQLVSKLFNTQRDFLVTASAVKKPAPDSPALVQLLQPTTDALQAVTAVREPGRERKFQAHISTISEGIPALGWVAVEPKPGPYVKDMKESAEFWANRVLKEHKDSNPKHVEWARSFVALLEELRKFVMQHHTTGLVWNPQGVDAQEYLASHATAKSAPAAPAAPPAPPAPSAPAPPPAPPAAPAPPSAQSTPKAPAAGDMSQVFAQLNRGEGVTTGLKKVDASQQTHKNPALRGSEPVPAVAAGTAAAGRPVKPPKPAAMAKKPPKLELDGTKWLVENYDGEAKPIIIKDTELGHTVNVFNCKSTVIQVKGKVNAVSLVNCSKVSVLVESLVSALSITSSPSFTVQITGKAPTITIDGTDGGQVYLSKDSLDIEIVTAKSSSINISLPVEGEEEGIFTERAVPEQLKTVISKGKLITSVIEHAG